MHKRYREWMDNPAVAYGLISALFVIAALVNLIILSDSYMASSLYAIPVLVAADRFSTRGNAAVGVAALAIFLVSSVLKDRPLAIVPFDVLGIAAVGYLGVMLARHRDRVIGERERLQTFMGLVAHDLGQPATVIRGNAQLIERRARREERGADLTNLAAIDGAVGQMQQLISDLQDASAVGTGEFVIRPAPTDLAAVVRQVVEEQRASASERRLTVEAPERLEGLWDPIRLRQLFENLISNAVKYSPDGSEIHVAVRRTPTASIVSVTDQGRGMSAVEQERLFHPFSRLDRTRGIKGMGLGLYIAKAVVDAHGGRIGIESEVGRGTTFYVTLPLAAPAPGHASMGSLATKQAGD